jgi:predicted GIY-YIG superfamily endonuclease
MSQAGNREQAVKKRKERKKENLYNSETEYTTLNKQRK